MFSVAILSLTGEGESSKNVTSNSNSVTNLQPNRSNSILADHVPDVLPSSDVILHHAHEEAIHGKIDWKSRGVWRCYDALSSQRSVHPRRRLLLWGERWFPLILRSCVNAAHVSCIRKPTGRAWVNSTWPKLSKNFALKDLMLKYGSGHSISVGRLLLRFPSLDRLVEWAMGIKKTALNEVSASPAFPGRFLQFRRLVHKGFME